MRLSLSTNRLQGNSSLIRERSSGNNSKPIVKTALLSNKIVESNIHVTSPVPVSKEHPQVNTPVRTGKVEPRVAKAKTYIRKSPKKQSAKSPAQSKSARNNPTNSLHNTKIEKKYHRDNDIALTSLTRASVTIYSTNRTYVRGDCSTSKPPRASKSTCTLSPFLWYIVSFPKNITSNMVIVITTDVFSLHFQHDL